MKNIDGLLCFTPSNLILCRKSLQKSIYLHNCRFANHSCRGVDQPFTFHRKARIQFCLKQKKSVLDVPPLTTTIFIVVIGITSCVIVVIACIHLTGSNSGFHGSQFIFLDINLGIQLIDSCSLADCIFYKVRVHLCMFLLGRFDNGTKSFHALIPCFFFSPYASSSFVKFSIILRKVSFKNIQLPPKSYIWICILPHGTNRNNYIRCLDILSTRMMHHHDICGTHGDGSTYACHTMHEDRSSSSLCTRIQA
mmetsp:Transcript_12276/g.17866  ORF Transcript_12276/g.17866 Transcript_12276/m.17866 type:complete len:251 (-) Transcript_12276:409-1161(-)